MSRQHIDTLKKLRAKLVEKRRAMAIRQMASAHAESSDHMISLQGGVEAIDRAIADEESMLAKSDGPDAETV